MAVTPTRREATGDRARHHAASRPVPTGPSLRTTVLASAAALGAVTTGTFSALIPATDTGQAVAQENPTRTHLAASSAPLGDVPAAFFTPVHVAPAAGAAALTDAAGKTPAQAEDHLALLGKATDIAARLAQEHAAAAEQARIDRIVAKGGLDGWIAEALRILDMPQSLAPSVKKIIMAESGGNPRAINNWDSNARRGTPSQGLMQTIPSTFRHYVHPSLAGRSITDPVANITAGVRYMVDNYGMSTLSAGGRSNHAGDYVGY